MSYTITIKKFDNSIEFLSFCIACLISIYFALILIFRQILGVNVSNIIFVVIVILLNYLLLIIKSSHYDITHNLPWILVCLAVVITSKQNILNGQLYWVLLYFSLTVSLITLSNSSQWIERSIGFFQKIILVHVFATIILFIFSPYLYSAIMLPFWNGKLPGGAGIRSIEDAYKAGISNHYSSNGNYCAISFVIYGTNWIVSTNKKKKNHNLKICIISLLALLLTTKRAHLIFSIATLLFIYYLYLRGNKISKLFYILFVAIIILSLFFILSDFVPVITEVLDRFTEQDDISNGRFAYWSQAIDIFKEHKLFGIGWLQYSYFNIDGTGAHNCYIQLLCETGIIGFSIFIFAILFSFISSIKLFDKIRNLNDEIEIKLLSISIGIQLFVILYCFTGNCFYDFTVIIYYLSLMISHALFYKYTDETLLKSKNQEINKCG